MSDQFPRKWTGADMRCPRCNKYLPDRCICNGPSIESQRQQMTTTHSPTGGAQIDLELTHTARGFALVRFTDRYNAACSLQQSSLATEDAIWLGTDDAEPKVMASQAAMHGIDPGDGTGWVPFPVPDEVSLNTRMHLTRNHVAALLPVLQYFVETGEVALARAGQQAGAEAFKQHLQHCSDEVAAWPSWKRRDGQQAGEVEAAGGIATDELNATIADLRAQLASAQKDAERLEFLMERGAWIAWGKDGESCRVFHRAEDGDDVPMMGWSHPSAWHEDPRAAIDAARAQLTNPTGN